MLPQTLLIHDGNDDGQAELEAHDTHTTTGVAELLGATADGEAS